MSGDIQPRKRKGKGKKKGSQQVMQLEESELDRQPPKIISYDFEDDVIETKAHHNNAPHHTKNNNKASSDGEGSGGGSGMVAKAIFLLLLVSLSVVVALILVELRAAMEENISTTSGIAEELVPPPPPPPPPAMMPPQDEGSVPPEASMPQEAEEEEPEPLATPPLEEYVKVVREVVMEPLPPDVPVHHKTEETVLSKEERLEDTAGVVEEVIEILTPMEEIEMVVPSAEDVELASSTPATETVDVIQAPLAEGTETTSQENIVEDAVASKEAIEEPLAERLPEPLETPIPKQKEEKEKASPEHTHKFGDTAKKDEEKSLVNEDDEEEEEADPAYMSPKVSLKEEEVEDEEKEEEEDWSQYGKEGNTGALTDAYLKVESLAEDILALDPKNAMVAQLTPHMTGVLRAMEEGQTEGLLETLNHIQVILEDVKKRIEDNEPIIIPGPYPQEETLGHKRHPQVVPESVPEPKPEIEAKAEMISEPEAVVDPQLEPLAESEPRPETESVLQHDIQTDLEPEYKMEPEMVSKAKLKPEYRPETEIQTEKETEVKADTRTQDEKKPVVEAESQTKVKVDKVTDTEVEMGTGIVTERQAGIKTDTQINISETKAQTEEEVGIETETKKTLKALTETQAEVKEETEKAGRDKKRKVDAETEEETLAKEEAGKVTKKVEDIDTKREAYAVTKDEVGTQRETDTPTGETQAEVKAEAEFGTETEEDVQPSTKEQPRLTPVPAREEHKVPQDTRSISEADMADLESQIIPSGAPEDVKPLHPPPAENEGPVTPQTAEGGAEPVPVDEVIPDPIHIEPLQELAKELKVDAAEEKQAPDGEEKDVITSTDDDSVNDNKIEKELDQADKLLPEGP